MDPFTPATEVAAAIRRREVSPVEVLDRCLAEVDRLDPVLNAVVWRNDEEARAEARRVAEALAAGEELAPFAGVPLPVKDLTRVAGWPVTYGSFGAPGGTSRDEALVVTNLRRAGFLLTARTNTPELGPIPVTENTRYGITRNPWDTDRSPGGSSGGAAAVVAAGMFPLAHGNDGGGSIRIPASCTGLVGLKANRGRVPAEVAGWFGASVEGALTRTVADAAAVLDAIAPADRLAWYHAPPPEAPFATAPGADPGRLRVGLLTRPPLDLAVHAGARDAVARAGSVLERLGHDVVPVDLELVPADALDAFLHVVGAGLGDYPDVDFSLVEPHNAASYLAARRVDSITLVQSMARLQRLARDIVWRWGRDFDVLVTPTCATPPPRAGAVLSEVHADPTVLPPDVLSMVAFTAPFNVTGQPAVSVPIHESGGLPVGVQLVGGPWEEGLLLAVAAQMEEADPWRERRPPPAA